MYLSIKEYFLLLLEQLEMQINGTQHILSRKIMKPASDDKMCIVVIIILFLGYSRPHQMAR